MMTQDADRLLGAAENLRSIDAFQQDALTAQRTGRRMQAGTIAIFFSRIYQSLVDALRIFSLQGELSRNYAHLNRLDDRMLADIGLDRNNLVISLQRQRDRTRSHSDFKSHQMALKVPAASSIPSSPISVAPPVSETPASIVGTEVAANVDRAGGTVSRAA